ncbi:MAG: DNA repair protein RecN [Lachnospiraceae bacterium]|nr:DNA repair protein RecN [Lachnospiraceae bacterium]
MLRNLHIKNLALIKEVDVDFTEGLNILTGETGAGKSIIVDSIGLALGERAQRELIRKDRGAAIAELVFEVTDGETVRILKEMDVEPEDGVLIISRKMQDGRSQFRVNGETRTASEVREIASLLLDIHGQSEHQKLLHEDHQLMLLDRFGGAELAAAKERNAEAYRTYAACGKDLRHYQMNEREREQRLSFLEYEISEIEEADLKEGEDEELEALFRKLSAAGKIASAVSEAHEVTGYDGNGAGEGIGSALKKLENVSTFDPSLEDLVSQLSQIESLLNDFNRDLMEYADELDYESGTLEETEDRLNIINRMKSRYGGSIPEILESLDERRKEVEELEDYEARRAAAEKRAEQALEKLRAAAEELTGIRKQTAERFVSEAAAEFSELNFARADFAIEFDTKEKIDAGGQDRIEFVIATNPGESRRPLKNVVSGGELSRLMLGIRTMFAGEDRTGTIIFDEIDSGISGRTAQKVAEKLAKVARTHQVLSITHLPQIAAMADAHYGITKTLGDAGAITNIEPLDPGEAEEEIARLIGGAAVTENTRRSAAEMREMCRQFKEEHL